MRTRTRRELLGEGAALGAAGPLAGVPEPAAARRRRRRRPKRQVAVLGGGIGGLTAAHELAERGFKVTVYERRAVGGKARSFGVPRSARGGRRPLPAEHGARFIPGLYQNLPDTMRRIPFGRNGGTFDNLVTATQESYARARGRSAWVVSRAPPRPPPSPLERGRQFSVATGEPLPPLPANEAASFAGRLLVFFTSCDARRF